MDHKTTESIVAGKSRHARADYCHIIGSILPLMDVAGSEISKIISVSCGTPAQVPKDYAETVANASRYFMVKLSPVIDAVGFVPFGEGLFYGGGGTDLNCSQKYCRKMLVELFWKDEADPLKLVAFLILI